MTKISLISVVMLLSILVLISGLTACSRDIKSDEKNRSQDEVTVDEDKNNLQEEEDQTIVPTVEPNGDTVQGENPKDTTTVIPEGASEEDNFDYSVDSSGLSNESYSWSWKRNNKHERVTAYDHGIDLAAYGAYYQVDTDEKVIYLTFDEGYENGYTAPILDVLKAQEVKAAFFVTKTYIESSPDLCKRMIQDGHVVANHSATHSSFPTLSNDQIKEELDETAAAFKEATGSDMAPFFRTPSGEYSERVLNEIRKQGYRSIFWSLAYGDWDVKNQPGSEYVYNHIMTNHHPGGIFLLHAVSQSNAQALNKVLESLKAEGYRFGSLYELE